MLIKCCVKKKDDLAKRSRKVRQNVKIGGKKRRKKRDLRHKLCHKERKKKY